MVNVHLEVPVITAEVWKVFKVLLLVQLNPSLTEESQGCRCLLGREKTGETLHPNEFKEFL